MRTAYPIIPLLLAVIVSACTRVEPPVFGEPVPISLSAESNVIGPRLASGVDGTVVLSWMQREDSGATLRYSTLELDEWQAATSVVSDERMFVNWADLPSVIPLADGHWVAHWLSKSAAATYAYDILLTQSFDNGMTWSDPLRPHSDGTPTEHGFVSIHAQNDSAALLWLDGRKTSNQLSSDPRSSSMTLRSVVVDPLGELSNEQLLDEIVCDCCQTDVAISTDGPIAVYRNRTVDEVRDIYVSRFSEGKWEPGSAIATDGWKISGCPVNGPAIDAQGDVVAIAWFTAANEKPVVRAAISTNAGRTFEAPVEIASRGSSGHVGVAIVDRASIAVSWVEADNRGTHAINIRGLTTQGILGPPETVGRSGLIRIYPQMARVDDKLILAWTDEITDATEIVSIEVPILGFYDR